VLDADGVGDVVTVAAGIRWAVGQGANVINLSLGSLQFSHAIEEALEEAEQHGVIVVASAGNWGAELPMEFPARDPHAIAIAASDAFGAPAPWTSYAVYVKLSAPGVAIRSAAPGGGYRMWSGTSMSTPFVAGTAALLLQLHPSWPAYGVMARLADAAAPMNGLSAAQFGKLGAGMLDAGAALAPDAPTDEDPPTIELSPGGR
jgi:subtilisin family serine protease